MNKTINRQQFLTGDLYGSRSPARPPWSQSEDAFIELCTGCGACWQQCPENILSKGRGDYPIIEFTQRDCSLCHRCADVCNSDAIYYQNNLAPWQIDLKIEQSCLAHQGVVCGTCVEQCDVQAISLLHQIGQVPQPKIDASLCNGCGACEAPCPSHSIHIKRQQYFSLTQPVQEITL